jgi:hypothetical protein
MYYQSLRSRCYCQEFLQVLKHSEKTITNWCLIVYRRCLVYKVLANISQEKTVSNSSDPDQAVS